MSLDGARRVRRTLKAAWQEIDGELVLLVTQEEKLLGLSAVAARIWQLADGTRTVGEIAAAIGREFDAPPERISEDVLSFAQRLVERGLLETVES